MRALTGLAVFVLAVSFAQGATIPNGDFSNDNLAGTWDVKGTAYVTNGQLYASATRLYTWSDNEWTKTPVLAGDAVTTIDSKNIAGGNLEVPVNANALSFDLSLLITHELGYDTNNDHIADTWVSSNPKNPDGSASLTVLVTYNVEQGNEESAESNPPFSQDINSMTTYTIDLTDPAFDREMDSRISIIIDPKLALPDPGLGDPIAQRMTIEAYMDNFQYVPEPMSMTLLLIGGVAAVLKRRKNN